MERFNVDIFRSNSNESEEENFAVNGMCSIHAAILELMALVGETFHRGHQVVAANARDNLLDGSLDKKFNYFRPLKQNCKELTLDSSKFGRSTKP